MYVLWIVPAHLPCRGLDRYPLPNGSYLDVHSVSIYATMNPASVGGGRSNLPRSLRSLFTTVQVGKPSDAEVRAIALDLFEGCLQHKLLDAAHVDKLLNFHQAAITAAERRDLGREGAPAEFNMRDLIKVSMCLNTATYWTVDPASLSGKQCKILDGLLANQFWPFMASFRPCIALWLVPALWQKCLACLLTLLGPCVPMLCYVRSVT